MTLAMNRVFNVTDLNCHILSYLTYDDSKRLSMASRLWYNLIEHSGIPFLSEFLYDHHAGDFKSILKHHKTIRKLHVRSIDDLEMWLPVILHNTMYLYLERCTFNNINNFITPQTRYIRIERCNEDYTDKQSLIPNLQTYPDIEEIQVC